MEYKVEINGLDVNATYREENIRDIFIPLLRRFKDLYDEKQKRILVLLAAPPGAGKSTLLSFLKYLSISEKGLMPITTIGMDGFHRYQDYLISHTIERDGQEYKMVDVKGCPETFDLTKLIERIKRISEGDVVGWPEYNRLTHNPIEDAIQVSGNIILLEGNYLLLNRLGWKDIKDYSDLTISIKADENLLRERLIERKFKSCNDLEKANAFVDFSDMYNVRTCLNESMNADIELKIMDDSSYTVTSGLIK